MSIPAIDDPILDARVDELAADPTRRRREGRGGKYSLQPLITPTDSDPDK